MAERWTQKHGDRTVNVRRTVLASVVAMVLGLGGAFATGLVAEEAGGNCPDQLCVDYDMCAYSPGWWCSVDHQGNICISGEC